MTSDGAVARTPDDANEILIFEFEVKIKYIFFRYNFGKFMFPKRKIPGFKRIRRKKIHELVHTIAQNTH